jgi:enamine deaminase RidA (YjgF/YER057c/UK114 family)
MGGINIQPHGWARPSGYSNGLLSPAGEILAVAGQVAWDANKNIVSDDFVAQFKQAVDNVVSVVRAAGGKPEDIIQMRVFVIDGAEYRARTRELGAAWVELMGRHYPAMSLVQVAALIEDGAQMEIEALAVLPPRADKGMPIPEDEDDPPTKTVSELRAVHRETDPGFDSPTKTLPAMDSPEDE